MSLLQNLRGVVRFERHRAGPRRATAGARGVGRRPAGHRPAPAPGGRVRLRRRRGRGRADPGRQCGRVPADPLPPPRPAQRRRSATSRPRSSAPRSPPPRARTDRVHPSRAPRGRARRGAGGGERRRPLHPLHAEHLFHRGSARRQRGPAVVPGLRLARPRVGQGDGGPCRRGALRGARADGRHRGAGAPGARRPPRVRVAARARAADLPRRRRCTRSGRGASCAATRSASPTSSAATWAMPPPRSPCRSTSAPSSTPRSAWADVEWLQAVWDGPIVLKGVQTEADAALRRTWGSPPSRCPTTAGASSTARRHPSRSWLPCADAVRRPHGHHLRRRPSARQRHREGAGGGRDGLHGGPRLSLRARRRPASAGWTACSRGGTTTWSARMTLLGVADVGGARPFAHRARTPGMSPLPARMRSSAPDARATACATMHRP